MYRIFQVRGRVVYYNNTTPCTSDYHMFYFFSITKRIRKRLSIKVLLTYIVKNEGMGECRVGDTKEVLQELFDDEKKIYEYEI